MQVNFFHLFWKFYWINRKSVKHVIVKEENIIIMKKIILPIVMSIMMGMAAVSHVHSPVVSHYVIAAETVTEEDPFKDDPIHGSTSIQNYYSTIDFSQKGTNLLSQLQALNGKKRTKTVGYKNMGRYYAQTDGDPNHSGNLICFYSGTSEPFSGSFGGSINREHVWPNSRGGNQVEGDIHMPRPTLVSENGSRGNSFYVEGQKSSSSGWDPAMESFGKEYYRGISARIIFYCVVASSNLKLVDTTNDQASNNSMGKLSDLLKWNLEYSIDATEVRRNDAAMDIQGNRNPFIDDRTLPCKIWGDYNSNTREVCAKYTSGGGNTDHKPTSITVTPNPVTLTMGEEKQLEVKVEPSEASQQVMYESSDTRVAKVSQTGMLTAQNEGEATIKIVSMEDTSIMAEVEVHVSSVKKIVLLGTPQKTAYQEGDIFDPTGIKVRAIYSDDHEEILKNEDCLWLDQDHASKELHEGTKKILCVYQGVQKALSLPEEFQVAHNSQVQAKELSVLSLSGTLQKGTYQDNENFDPTGLKVKAKYGDGSMVEVTNKVQWAPTTMKSSTTYVTGTYQEGAIERTVIVLLEKKESPSKQGCGKSSMSLLWTTIALFAVIGISLMKRKGS